MELVDRLKECQSRIGKMCSEGRPPRMSVPADRERDDDLFISSAIADAIAALVSSKPAASPTLSSDIVRELRPLED